MPGRDELLEWLRYQLEVRKTLGKDKAKKDKEGNNLANTRLGKRDPLDGTYKAIKADKSREKGIKTFNSGVPTDQNVRAIKDPFGGLALDWKNVTDEESIETEKLIGEVLIAYKYKLFVYLSILFRVIRENDPTPCTCKTFVRVGNRCFQVCDGSGKTLEECLAEPEPVWPPAPRQPIYPENLSNGGSYYIYVGYSLGYSKWDPNASGSDDGVPQVGGSLWVPETTTFCGGSDSKVRYGLINRSNIFWEAYFKAPGYYGGSSGFFQIPTPGFIIKNSEVYSPYVIESALGTENYTDNVGNNWIIIRYPVALFAAGTPYDQIVLANALVVGVAYSATYLSRTNSTPSPPPFGGAWQLQSQTNGYGCSPFAISDPCTDPGQGNPPKECPFPREKRSITYYLGGVKKTPCECIKFNYSDPHKLYFSAINGEVKDGELTSEEIIRVLCGTKKVPPDSLYFCKQKDIWVKGSEIKINTISHPENFKTIPEDWRNSLLSTSDSWFQSVTLKGTGKPYIDENRYKTNVNILSFENGSVTTHALIDFDKDQLIDNVKFIDLIATGTEKDKTVLKVSHFIEETKETTKSVDFKTTDKVYGLLDAKQGITKITKDDIVGFSGYVANIGKVTLSPVGYSSPVYAKSSIKPKKEITLVEDVSALKGWKFVIALVKDKFYCGFARELSEDKTEYQFLDVVIIKNAQKDPASELYENPALPKPNGSNPVDAFFQSYKAGEEFKDPDQCYTDWLNKDGVVFVKKSGEKYRLTDVDFDQIPSYPSGTDPEGMKKLKDFILTHKGKTKIKVKNVSVGVEGKACLTNNITEKTLEVFGLELSEDDAKKLELLKIAFYTPPT